MHKMEIEHLGPIEHCVIHENQFIVLTGPQAAGKSTVAKVVFFFRTVKEDILTILLKRAAGLTNEFETDLPLVSTEVEKVLRAKFLSTFGSSWAMNSDMRIQCSYDNTTSIEVSLKDGRYPGEPNYVWVDYSKNLRRSFLEWQQARWGRELFEIKADLSEQLAKLFDDAYETVFIPAGRSMITLLTSQLSYIFATMDDGQRRSIDYCTQTYIERILKLKPLFTNGIQGLLSDKLHLTQDAVNKPLVQQALDLIDLVLKGKYIYVDGEERLRLENGKYVKINFTSSGQQESVWIFNLIFYYLLENKPIYLILEEPESHLYPDAQKTVAELIGLLLNAGNEALITTHSPYILGEINNLLLAGNIGNEQNKSLVSKVVSDTKWLKAQATSAYYVLNGELTYRMDPELQIIQNEVIDGASTVINDENDALYHILLGSGGEA